MKHIIAFLSVLCILFAGIACVVQMACGAQVQHVEAAVIDCATAERASAVAKLEPSIKALIEQGSFATIENGLLDLASDIAGCVIASAVNDITASANTALKSVVAPGAGFDLSATVLTIKAKFETARTSRFGGARFLTHSGPL